MSDNEQTVQKSLEESSGDESASEAAKQRGHNGAPVNQPRKDSTSSSASSSDDDDESDVRPQRVAVDDSDDDSSISKSKSVSKSEASAASKSSVSGAEQPPQPKSRSVSVEEAVSPPAPAERKKSLASEKSEDHDDDNASDTDDDVEKEELEEPEPVMAPVPVERKVSIPVEEFTEEEVQRSKRETVHLDEAEKAEVIAEVSRKSSASSVSSEEDMDQQRAESPIQEAMPATIIEHDDVEEEVSNGHHDAAKDDSSSSSEEAEVEKPKPEASQDRPESPLNGRRSGGGDISKIYTSALNNNNNNNNNNVEKGERMKPSKDITQIYTQTLAKASPPASPKVGPRSKPAQDITKLYTGKLDTTGAKSPAEKLSPRKHNMSTAVDRDAIRSAYDDVRSDTSDTEWAVFKFDEGNCLRVTATGNDFNEFKSYFGNEDRGFGYIRIKTGDEMSKRSKFVLVTWVGPNVSVMKKAKMSTDKALMKDIIQNMSVEMQLENQGEFSFDHFKMQVDKASGARYGTGVRDL